jgi:alkylated DNA repair dioxygenase AlkB
LIPGTKRVKKFELPDAELVLKEQFFDKAISDSFYQCLLSQTPWREHERKIYDKIVVDPRLIAWYDQNAPAKWTPELLTIKARVEADCGIAFDSVLLNYYRDGRDSVSWHSDKKPVPGKNPPIASISFGETRPFRVRHKFDKSYPVLEIPLTHGSFLLMGGSMQDYWEHHIPKTNKPIAPGINLTFRITGKGLDAW